MRARSSSAGTMIFCRNVEQQKFEQQNVEHQNVKHQNDEHQNVK
jgi:hypothetical protein